MKPTYSSPPLLCVAATLLALVAGSNVRADSSYKTVILGDGPLAYYRFSESAVVSPPYPIATNYGALGDAANASVVAAGSGAEFPLPCGQAGPMTGSGSYLVPTAFADQTTNYPYLNIPWQSALAVSGPFSVEFWAKPGHNNDFDSFCTAAVMANWDSTSVNGRSGWIINQTDTTNGMNSAQGWYFRGYKGNKSTAGAFTASVDMPIDLNHWYHIVGVYDGAYGRLYVDGVLVSSAAASGYAPCPGTYPLTIGARGNNNSTLRYPWKGNLSEFAFYGSALSANEVAAHYSCATTNPAYYPTLVGNSTPLVYLRLNETWSGTTTATNSSSAGSTLNGGYRNLAATATDLDAPTYPGLETTNRTAVMSSANSSYVRTPALNTTMSSATFECLIKPSGYQQSTAGLFIHRKMPNATHGLSYYADGAQLAYNWNDNSAAWNWASGLYPAIGQWSYAAVSISPSQATIYLYDGTTWQKAVNPVAHASATFSVPDLIGWDTQGIRYFDGSIDEMAVYNKALSEGQLRIHAMTAFGGLGAPQLVYDPPVVSPSTNVVAGTSFTLIADAYGAPPLAFQWQHAGTNLPGATASSYTKSGTTRRDAGNYVVVVSNGSSSVTSLPVAVTVLDAPPNETANRLLWLKLDETSGTVAADSSTNSANESGTVIGFPSAPLWTTGSAIGGALRVNSGSDVEFVMVNDPYNLLDFSSSQEFAISLWVKARAAQTKNAGVFAKGWGGGGEAYAMDINNGTYRFFVRDLNGQAMEFQTAVAPNGNWQHLVADFSIPLNLVKVYVNGAEVLSGTPPSSLLSSIDTLTFGARPSTYGSGFDLPVNGTLDDIRIYSRWLSQGDVTLLYTNALPIRAYLDAGPASRSVYPGGSVTLSSTVSGSTPFSYQWTHDGVVVPGATSGTLVLNNIVDSIKTGSYIMTASNSVNGVTSSAATVSLKATGAPSYVAAVVADLPEAFWRLDETAVGTVRDSMGRHDGSSADQTVVAQPGALAEDSDTCMTFAGNEHTRIPVAYSAALNASNFSVECWAQYEGPSPITSGNYYTTVASDTWQNGDARGYILYATPNNQWESYIALGGTSWSINPGAPALPAGTVVPNQWAYLVMTSDGLTNSLYANGVLVNQLAQTKAMSPNPNVNFGIGYNPMAGNGGGYYFVGSIDEVAYYPSVLSADRIRSHYQLGTLGANNLPIFAVEPASQTVVVGTTATFSPSVAGASPMTYQWKKGEGNLAGKTTQSLSLPGVDYTDAGSYTVGATNSYGGALSLAATLTVVPPASVTNLVSRISRGASGLKLELIWPLGYTLYYATDLAAPHWQPVSGASAPYYNVPINPATPQVFFKIQ